jgi:hypothetical protein
MYGLTTRPEIADLSYTSSGSRTPETRFANAMVWRGPRMGGNLYCTESRVETSEEEDAAQSDRRKYRQAALLDESKSGIGWKFANQGTYCCLLLSSWAPLTVVETGFNLLSLAAEESSIISQDPRYGNASFARQLYIHAILYLLRALPTDLTVEEQLSIRSSLPHGVMHLQLEDSMHASRSSQSRTTNQPSILHRTLASTIVQVFILFQFMLPHLKYVLSSAYQYERTHKISEKVISGSISTVDTLGKRGLLISEAILSIGDGRMGQLLAQVASWFVEGVAGGIQDGLGEGMVIIGATRSASDVIAR